MTGFIMYLTTKLPNPSYTPEVSAKTSIIDFTVTMQVCIYSSIVMYHSTCKYSYVLTSKYVVEGYLILFVFISLYNFQGLEDQLLGRVIMKEKAELEVEKLKLMEDVTGYKKKLKELEDNLLYKLTSTQVRFVL